MRIGVVAIQGGFEAHRRSLDRLGVESVEIRSADNISDLDGVILPGGESTTIWLGLNNYGLAEPLVEFAQSGGAVLGTCAGLIVLDRNLLGLMDIEAVRNAYGRQTASFETDLQVKGLGDDPFRAVFIRAPVIDRVGGDVDVMAVFDGRPVVARQDKVMVCAFHPELTHDLRMHAYFLALASKKLEQKSA